jgi:hypothetical protein
MTTSGQNDRPAGAGNALLEEFAEYTGVISSVVWEKHSKDADAWTQEFRKITDDQMLELRKSLESVMVHAQEQCRQAIGTVRDTMPELLEAYPKLLRQVDELGHRLEGFTPLQHVEKLQEMLSALETVSVTHATYVASASVQLGQLLQTPGATLAKLCSDIDLQFKTSIATLQRSLSTLQANSASEHAAGEEFLRKAICETTLRLDEIDKILHGSCEAIGAQYEAWEKTAEREATELRHTLNQQLARIEKALGDRLSAFLDATIQEVSAVRTTFTAVFNEKSDALSRSFSIQQGQIELRFQTLETSMTNLKHHIAGAIDKAAILTDTKLTKQAETLGGRFTLLLLVVQAIATGIVVYLCRR